MVSLSRGTNSMVEGGTFFGHSGPSEPDVQGLLQPVVGEGKLKKFTPLGTVMPAAFLLALAVMHFHLNKKHHESRLNGYLEFYQKTQHHSRIPFYISSLWNTILLLLSTLFHDQYHDLESRCKSNGFLTPMNYACFIITLENVFMIPTIVYYICKVYKFNKSRPCPDVQRDEWMASFVQDSYSAGEVGYREQDNHMEELLEKQADMLRYLKEQNSRLVQKVLILNNLLKAQTESLQC
ncbi:hypothetical protein RUM44_001273 [Polyplax serrata]|uniref:Transmembrane protein 192 n=1 Tax=Polyplax serrata TaxID=468196 RepID=A0ABR1AJL4_POLSC